MQAITTRLTTFPARIVPRIRTLDWYTVLRRTGFVVVLLLFPLLCLISWTRILFKKTFGLKPSILWAPTPILNIVHNSEVMQKLGYKSETLVYTTYYITNEFDHDCQSAIQKAYWRAWYPSYLMIWSMLRFDIYHFFYDGGLWSGMKIVPEARWLELPLLRLAGKRIVASAFGGDVRTRRDNEKWEQGDVCKECPTPKQCCLCDGDAADTNVRHYRDWSNKLIAMGDMHDFVLGSDHTVLHWPADVNTVPFVGAKPHDGPVRIVHSPNHRFFKGTSYIEAAVESLQQQGYAVELDIVERVSHTEAKRRYGMGDIVVAQCLIGWVGSTEIEAMSAGKPVVTFLRSPKYLAHAPDCPAVSAHADVLEDELRKLVVDGELREELGNRGRQWVADHWSYDAIGARFESLHRDVWRSSGLGSALARKWRRHHRGEGEYRLGRPSTAGRLGEWPVHMDADEAILRIESGQHGQPPFDEQGIPRFHAGQGRYAENAGVVAEVALHYFHGWLAHPEDESHRDQFLKCATWLRDRLEVDEAGVGRWFHTHFDANHPATLGDRWLSARTQALGVSALLRAEQLAPQRGFGMAARAAVLPLTTDIDAGGTLAPFDCGGGAVAQEFAAAPTTDGLLGAITAILGLSEFAAATGDESVRRVRDECVHGLRSTLGEYDHATGIRRALLGDGLLTDEEIYWVSCSLVALQRATGETEFGRTSRRWSRRVRRRRLVDFVNLRAPL